MNVYLPQVRVKQCEFEQSLPLEELEELEPDLFGFTDLEGHQVACFDSGGEKLLCLPQILEIVNYASIETIESTISTLGLVLQESSSLKKEILRRYRVIPQRSVSCPLMTQSNAERLCKILNLQRNRHQFPHLPNLTQHRIRVEHDCFGQQKGILLPQQYVSVDSKCIECFNCGELFSPNNFVGHVHDKGEHKVGEPSMCHWGFQSSNWRWYLRLADDPSRCIDEENSLREYLEEIKHRYSKPMDDPLLISEHGIETPRNSESVNTSPSLPTPPSLSPPSEIHRNIQQSGSIFQQCILKIFNTPLENNEDRHQILNFLVMIRQEHLNQISTLISERQKMIKVLTNSKLNPPSNSWNVETQKTNNTHEESHVELLNSVCQKLSILKRSRCVKRKSRSPLPRYHNPYCSTSPVVESERSAIHQDHQSLLRVEVIDCDSSASNEKMAAISSRDQPGLQTA